MKDKKITRKQPKYPPMPVKYYGQALITILLLTFVILSWAVQIAITNLSSVSSAEEITKGMVLLQKAEGYLENAALLYLRQSNYQGETISDLQDPSISCTITLTDIPRGKHIISTCSKNQRSKRVGIFVTYADGIFSFTRISEE